VCSPQWVSIPEAQQCGLLDLQVQEGFLMRRVILLILLCLALPLAVSASSVDVQSTGGTITGSNAGLSLSGDTITSYGGIGGSNLGTVTFTTGAFVSGGPTANGTLGPGGTFTVTLNGSVMGLPTGTVFSGTFTSGTWTIHPGNTFTFEGDVKSSNGLGTISLVTFSGSLANGGSIDVASGDIVLTTTEVPEPGTLGLLGTGLVGIGGLLRRKRIFRR